MTYSVGSLIMRNLVIVGLLFVMVMFWGCKDNSEVSTKPVDASLEAVKEAVGIAPIEESVAVVKELVPASPGFFDAALNGEIVAVKAAINSGVDVNSQNKDKQTAVMLAAFNGYTDIVKLLIENGADVNNVRSRQRAAGKRQAIARIQSRLENARRR